MPSQPALKPVETEPGLVDVTILPKQRALYNPHDGKMYVPGQTFRTTADIAGRWSRTHVRAVPVTRERRPDRGVTDTGFNRAILDGGIDRAE